MREPTSERWVPVRDFEPYYEVGDKGFAYSLRTGRTLRPSYSNTGGYPMVIFTVNGKRTGHYIHTLVAEAFIGECPDGQQVRHKDGNPRNGAASNLEYGTSSDNKYDQVRHGTHYEGSKTHCDNGHEFTEENTRIWYWPDGSFRGRVCRICNKERVQAWREQHAELGPRCSQDGCEGTVLARGLCSRHYQQQWRATRESLPD